MRTREKSLNQDVINRAIPNNIDRFVDYLQKRGIKYHDFKTALPNFQRQQIKDFIRDNPDVLQLQMF